MLAPDIEILKSLLNQFVTLASVEYKKLSQPNVIAPSKADFDPDRFVVMPELYHMHFIERGLFHVKSISQLLDLYKTDRQIENQIGLILRAGLLDLFYILRLYNDSGHGVHESMTTQAIETDYAEYRISQIISEIDRLKRETTDTSQNKINQIRINTLIEFGKLYNSFEKNNFIRTPLIKKQTFGEIKSYLTGNLKAIEINELLSFDEADAKELFEAIIERYEFYNMYQHAGGATPRPQKLKEEEIFCHLLSSLDFIILGSMISLNRMSKYGVKHDSLAEINTVFDEVYSLYSKYKAD